jgi:hypothetical protein
MKTRVRGAEVSHPFADAEASPRSDEAQSDAPRPTSLGHVRSSRALASVAIDHAAIAIQLADLGLDTVHLTLGRDENTGLIVAAALDAERRRPREVLRLFGRESAREAAAELGAVWTCPGIPEAIVVDHGTDYHDAGFREAAEQLGVQVLHRPQSALPGRAHLETLLGRSGACRDRHGRSVVTMPVLVGAVHVWIAACLAAPLDQGAASVRGSRPRGSGHTSPLPHSGPQALTQTSRGNANRGAGGGKAGRRH